MATAHFLHSITSQTPTPRSFSGQAEPFETQTHCSPVSSDASQRQYSLYHLTPSLSPDILIFLPSLLPQSHSFFKAHIYQLLGLVSHAGAQIKHRERFWGLSAVARTSYFSHQHRFHRISVISKKSTSLGGERLWKDVTKLRIAPQQGLGFDGDGYTARGLSYI